MPHDFFKRNGRRIILVVLLSLLFVWVGTKRTFLSNSNAVEDWLPEHYQETRDYQWFLEHFPHEGFIVVSWEGCVLSNDQIEIFAQKLVPSQTIDHFSLTRLSEEEKTAKKPENGTGVGESNEDYFCSVMTGPRLVRLLEEAMMKSSRGERTPEELHALAVEKLRGTLIGPDGESTAMIVTLNNGYKGGGKKMQRLIDRVKAISIECGLPDTTKVSTGNFAIRAGKAVVDTFREILFGRHPQTNGVILGGPPVDNAALDREGTQTLFRLAGFCAVISVTLAMICLKDVMLTSFVFGVSVLAAGMALALVSFTGGKCDSILLSMPALIYVLAMSGSIHFVNYWQDAVRDRGLDNAAERAVSHAFSPCFFAQLTTAIGLGSLFAGKLIPITNFGLYSALGVMTTLLLLFFYLPALLHVFPRHSFVTRYGNVGMTGHESRIHLFWQRFGRMIIRYHNAVAILCFAAMIFFACYLPKIKTSVKMMNFFSDDAEIIAHYHFLEEKLGALVPMELVLRFDNTKLASENDEVDRLRLIGEIGERLKAELPDEIGGIMSAALFFPDPDTLRDPGTFAHRVVENGVRINLEKNRENLKEYLTFEGNPSLTELETFFREEIATESNQPENAELLASRRRSLDLFTAKRTLFADKNVVDLASLMAWLSGGDFADSLTPGESAELSAACRLWQQKRGTELWRLSVRVWALKRDIDYSAFIRKVRDCVDPRLTEICHEWTPRNENALSASSTVLSNTASLSAPAVSAVYTGMVPLVYKTQHALIQGLTSSLVMAFVLITLMMIILLGNIGAGLVAMLPNIFPVIVVFGFMGWAELPVDVGTMMTASIALGVAIDDTLHYLTWYRDGLRKGKTPKEAADWGYLRCAKAMTESTLIVGLGLSAFMLSTFVPTQRFGLLMLATLFAAEVGDLIFLPALLTGPLGRYFDVRRKSEKTQRGGKIARAKIGV